MPDPATPKPAAGSYSVNTAHAKCPDYLWALNDGSGTSVADVGKTGGFGVSLTNTPTWNSDAQGTVLSFASASSQYGWSGTGSPFTTSLCLCAWVKPPNADNLANKTIFGAGLSGSTTASHVLMRFDTSERLEGRHADAVPVGSNEVGTDDGDIYDGNWHFVAVKSKDNEVKISIDGSTWSAGDTTAVAVASAGINRFSLGGHPNAASGYLDGDLLMAYAFKDDHASWDDTWIASLYSDPWQFLSTGAATKASFYRMLRNA